MAVATRALKARRKKAAIAAPPGMPQWKTSPSLDPLHFVKIINWYDTETGDSYTWEHLVLKKMTTRIGPGQRFSPRCAACGTIGNLETKTFTCHCVRHVDCAMWIPSEYIQAQRALGACKQSHHCFQCCKCVVCAKCKKLMTIKPKNYPSFMRSLRGPKQNGLICTYCKSCKECCKCQPCANCGGNISKACVCRAMHHADCCDSDSLIQQKIGLLFIKRQPIFHEGTNFQHNRGRRFLSVESEIESFGTADLRSLNQYAKQWGCAVVTEGTVPQGGEICTAPASGDKFESLIKGLTDIYKQIGAKINVRCGMHVHVDARDFYYADLINLAHLYNKVEVALFAALPPWRRLSRFAVPCRHTLMDIANGGTNLIETYRDIEMASSYDSDKVGGHDKVRKPSIALKMASKLYGAKSLAYPKKVHKSADNQRVRYMALNMHSWVYRRTIEFRHYPGATNLEEMTLWPQVLGAIMDTAKRWPVRSAKRNERSIVRLSPNPVEALLEILEPKSWINPELKPFIERLIAKWSPDFSNIWPLMQDSPSAITPFQNTIDTKMLSFDIERMAYTYLPAASMNWDLQWDHPTRARGRYATMGDLMGQPRFNKVAWLAPVPKKEEAPAVSGPGVGIDLSSLRPPGTNWQMYTTTNAMYIPSNTFTNAHMPLRNAAQAQVAVPTPQRTRVRVEVPEPERDEDDSYWRALDLSEEDEPPEEDPDEQF